MRVALITDGGFPFERREGGAWCERLVRGLASHEFRVYALAPEGDGRLRLPPNVTGVYVLSPPRTGPGGGRARRGSRAVAHYRELVQVLAEGAGGGGGVGLADRFADALYGLAESTRASATPSRTSTCASPPASGRASACEGGALPRLLRSDAALRALEEACRAAGTHPALGAIGVRDLITAAELLAQALRPLSVPWYGPHALGAADLCHVTSCGTAALPGLLARRFFGTPLLITEYGVRLRQTLLAYHAVGHSAPVRALLTAFHRLLAGEAYRAAAAITPGNAHTRHWQERCGADRTRIRTIHPGYPGLAAQPVPPPAAAADGGRATLLWAGRPEPAKDLVGLLHAFAEVRKAEPGALLRIVLRGDGDHAYLAHCRQLAAHLFPDEAPSAVTVGKNPVSFETQGGNGTHADVAVLSSVVEGFPHGLVEAMFAERATVSTDVGAVREVIGGTGLVVPPRNPRALADACIVLLRDPARRDRLGAAARERALALFTVEQNVQAFREIYLAIHLQAVAHSPVTVPDGATAAVPFARTVESHVPGRWAGVPSWARLQEDPV